MNEARAARQGRRVYRALRLGVALARWLPEPVADGLCRLAGRLAYLLATQARSNVLANLSHALPHADEATLRRTARRTFYYVARSYYELVRMPWLTSADLHRQFRIEGWWRLHAALAAGRGVITPSAHMGNFSCVPLYSGTVLGVAVTTAMEQLEPPALFDLVVRLRSGHGARFVPTGSAGLRQMLGALRRGEALALLSDRDISDSGIDVPFFGWPARLPPGPAALALRTGAVLLPMYTYREGRDRSVLVVQEPIELVRNGDREADIAATMARVAAAMEEAIRRAPEQWVVLEAIWDDAEPDIGLRWPRSAAAASDRSA